LRLYVGLYTLGYSHVGVPCVSLTHEASANGQVQGKGGGKQRRFQSRLSKLQLPATWKARQRRHTHSLSLSHTHTERVSAGAEQMVDSQQVPASQGAERRASTGGSGAHDHMLRPWLEGSRSLRERATRVSVACDAPLDA